MTLGLEEAREYLRIDGTDNDEIIFSLLKPYRYIEVTTGMTPQQQQAEPLAKTVSKFILKYGITQSRQRARSYKGLLTDYLKLLQ